MAETKVKVTDGDELIEVEVIVDAIVAISEGMTRLRKSRLKDNALFLLIQHAAPNVSGNNGRRYSKPTITEIKAVIAGIEGLKREYVKS